MPSIYQIGLPIPHNYDEFENMVKVYFSSIYSLEFQKYGRSGQRQSGIDLIANSIGIQCKNFYNTTLTVPLIEKEISAAEALSPALSTYYIVTTAQRDVVIQNYIRNRTSHMKIEIYYWDVIENFLLQNPQIKNLFYPIENNSTQLFIDQYLKICYMNEFYRVFQNTDFTGTIRQEDFIAIDNIKESLVDLVHSQMSIGVKHNVLSDINSFIGSLDYITGTLAWISTPNQNGISTPNYPPEKKDELINGIEENSIHAFEIYSNYIPVH